MQKSGGYHNMALIHCPECNKEISDSATICVHCGFPIKKELTHSKRLQTDITTNIPTTKTSSKKTKYRNIILTLLSIALCITLIVVCVSTSKQAEIEKYRVEFSSEDDMRSVLRSGNWWLTSFGGGHTIGAYVTFEHSFFTYIDTDGEYEPSRTQYKLL